MPTPNVNLILQAVVALQNNLISPAPQIAKMDFGNPTMGGTNSVGGTQFFYEPYFQALVGGVAVTLPAAKIFAIFVQNLSPTGVLQVTFTPFGGAPCPVNYGPNGLCILFDPLETGTGFSGLTLAGVGGTIPASVLVAL